MENKELTSQEKADYENTEAKLIEEEIEKEMFSPCCINSLAKRWGINKYQCVKCRKIWRIEEI